VLAQPSLVNDERQHGQHTDRGEIPIPVPQAGGTGAAVVTIEYKQFGISLNVAPTVGENDEIALVIRPEVSALDYANGIVLSGFLVPAFKTRKAERPYTSVQAHPLPIGGLVSQEESRTRGDPLLSKIPVLGNFSRIQHQKKNSEFAHSYYLRS